MRSPWEGHPEKLLATGQRDADMASQLMVNHDDPLTANFQRLNSGLLYGVVQVFRDLVGFAR
jgi:hypothetical protein